MPRQTFHAQFPLASLREHPANPNIGNVDAIAESLEAHGFVGVIVAQEIVHDGFHAVVAGNHRLKALRMQGATHAPVMLVDMTDQQALRFMLADNRTGSMAVTDEARLAEVLHTLFSEDTLEGTGFSEADYDALNDRLGLSRSFTDLPGETPTDSVVEPTVTFSVKLPASRATSELEASLKDVCVAHGGKFAVRRSRGSLESV